MFEFFRGQVYRGRTRLLRSFLSLSFSFPFRPIRGKERKYVAHEASATIRANSPRIGAIGACLLRFFGGCGVRVRPPRSLSPPFAGAGFTRTYPALPHPRTHPRPY